MVEQIKYFQWEVTLANDSVKKEADGIKYDLNYEVAGSIKKITLKQVNGSEFYEVNLANGEFNKNGVKVTPSGFGNGSLGDYSMVYFRRNIIRVDETGPKQTRVIYYIGYKKGGVEHLLKVSPAIGNVAEEIVFASR